MSAKLNRLPGSRGVLRVQVLSDLHAERGARSVPSREDVETDADIVLVPGDTHHAPHAIPVLAELFPAAQVIATVAGNHEHYGTNMGIDEGIDVMRRAAARSNAMGQKILVLENEARVIDVRGVSVRFVGCTLWTDFGLFGDPVRDAPRVRAALNDFVAIRGRGEDGESVFHAQRLGTAEVAARHAESREFLRQTLNEFHDGPTLVLTHHCVSMRSVHARWKKDRISAGFASHADDLVALGACLWVHGHTHDSFSYRDEPGGTLVVCNPAGYLMGGKRENSAYDPRLMVDIRRGGPLKSWRAGLLG